MHRDEVGDTCRWNRAGPWFTFVGGPFRGPSKPHGALLLPSIYLPKCAKEGEEVPDPGSAADLGKGKHAMLPANPDETSERADRSRGSDPNMAE